MHKLLKYLRLYWTCTCIIIALSLNSCQSEMGSEAAPAISTPMDSTSSDSLLKLKVKKAPIQEKEYLADQLEPIRKQLKRLLIYNSVGWTGVDKRKLSYKDHPDLTGAIEYRFLKNELKKLRIIELDSSLRMETDIYLKDSLPFFALACEVRPRDTSQTYSFNEVLTTDSIFLDQGQVIRIKSSRDCGAPFTEEYRQSLGEEIKQKVNQAFKLL